MNLREEQASWYRINMATKRRKIIWGLEIAVMLLCSLLFAVMA